MMSKIRSSLNLATPVCLAAVLLSGVHVAVAQPFTASAMRAFHSIDLDGDGKLDRRELKAAADIDFKHLDIDRDGTLTRSELAKTRSETLLLPFPKRLDRAASFAAADADHDGKIDEREYGTAVVRAYLGCDLNHDGTIELSDLRRCA